MRISVWSSDVCSSDLRTALGVVPGRGGVDRSSSRERVNPVSARRAGLPENILRAGFVHRPRCDEQPVRQPVEIGERVVVDRHRRRRGDGGAFGAARDRSRQMERRGRWRAAGQDEAGQRSEEHTSELQSLMRISYAVFCLKKKKKNTSKE